MNQQTLKMYRDRWRAVAAIERAEQQASTLEQRWHQMSAAWRLARTLNLPLDSLREGENEIWERWDKLRERSR